MKVWSYHPETKVLVSDAPREAQTVWNRRHLPSDDETRYAIPANSTGVKPPREKAGTARVFDAKRRRWVQTEDHRGATVFETATGRPRKVADLGPLPDDVTVLEPGLNDKWDVEAKVWSEDTGKRAAHDRQFVIDEARKAALQRVAEATAAKVSSADIAVALGLREPVL